jgi:hypothetical protein
VVLCEKKECADIYRKLMLSDAVKYNDREKDQEKTETQKENWVSQDELKGIYEALDKDTRPLLSKSVLKDPELQRLQNFLILSLYVLQKPRRLQDYTEMKLKNVNKEEDNYIDKTKFVFNVYKTAKQYGKQILLIPESLAKCLSLYFKHHPVLKSIKGNTKVFPITDFLLSFNCTDPITADNFITRILNKIFDKKIGCSMLRHIYLSGKQNVNEMIADANAMGHSLSQQREYLKASPPPPPSSPTTSPSVPPTVVPVATLMTAPPPAEPPVSQPQTA